LKKYYEKSIKYNSDNYIDNYDIDTIINKAHSKLNEISENTQFFTGADLQSLIYNSFLLAAKRNIQKNIDKLPIITSDDLIEAKNNFKRSLSEKDIKFFNEIKKAYVARAVGKKISYENDSHLNITFNNLEKRHDELLQNFKEDKMKTTFI